MAEANELDNAESDQNDDAESSENDDAKSSGSEEESSESDSEASCSIISKLHFPKVVILRYIITYSHYVFILMFIYHLKAHILLFKIN